MLTSLLSGCAQEEAVALYNEYPIFNDYKLFVENLHKTFIPLGKKEKVQMQLFH